MAFNEKAFIEGYKAFLDAGKTERECVKEIAARAEKAGYKDIAGVKTLKAGDKVYVNKMGKSILLYHIGKKPIEKGMRILGAHIDSPRLDVKPNPLYEKDGVVYLNLQYYGGIKKYQWVTLPLAIHGVVFRADGSRVDVRIGEEEGDPVFCVSDILPHIAQDQMDKKAKDFIDGENLDVVLSAFNGKAGDGKKAVLDFLKKKYGLVEEDFRSAELEIVPAGKARDSGWDRGLILAYGQDDRSCAYPSLIALLDQKKTPEYTACAVLVDKEEIGSVGATGMNSHLIDNATMEVVERLGGGEFTLRHALENSLMISSDVNSAYDPLNASLYDKQNSSPLGCGIAFCKYTGGRGKSSSSDANAEFISKIRTALDKDGVTWQIAQLAKVDVGGGGTIAKFAASWGMQVIDCGVPVLSMHSPWELTSRFDIIQGYKAYASFLSIE